MQKVHGRILQKVHRADCIKRVKSPRSARKVKIEMKREGLVVSQKDGEINKHTENEQNEEKDTHKNGNNTQFHCLHFLLYCRVLSRCMQKFFMP